MSRSGEQSDRFVVGVDVGGTHLQVGVLDREGRVLGAARGSSGGRDGLDAVASRIEEAVAMACQEAGVARDRIAAIGLGVPGAIDSANGRVLQAPNLGWEDVDLVERLSCLGAPTVIENDVNAAAFGEWKTGAGRGVQDVAAVWVGTGIGGGLILDGRLLRGAMASAGEIGFMTLLPDAPLGSRAFEHVCSRKAIVDRLIYLMERSAHSSLCDVPVETLRAGGAREIAQACAHGDELALAVVEEAARYIGVMVASIVSLLSVSRIVLGGGLTEALGGTLLAPVRAAFDEHVFPRRAAACEIVATELCDNAGLVGAGMLAWEIADANA